jgi:putative DNA primase/helicase
MEWANDELDLPYRSCSIDQAYRAYLKYAQRTGDRFPLQKAVFKRMVIRVSESVGPLMSPSRPPVRELMAAVTEEGSAKRRTTRLLLVCPVPDDTPSQSAWASDTVSAFEQDLRDYLGYGGPPSPEDERSGTKTAKPAPKEGAS